MMAQIALQQETGTATGPQKTSVKKTLPGVYLDTSGTQMFKYCVFMHVPDSESVLQQRFAQSAEIWRNETGMYSITTKKVAHTEYQRILAMGSKVIPLILIELQERGGYWFEALEALVGSDPFSDSGHLSMRELKAQWIEWGKREGHLA